MDKNEKEAFEVFNKCENIDNEKGYAVIQNWVGFSYEYGKGCEKNE